MNGDCAKRRKDEENGQEFKRRGETFLRNTGGLCMEKEEFPVPHREQKEAERVELT